MSALQFLTEWTVRSSILIGSGALLLRALRVKDASIRATAWTAMLCGSLMIPTLTALLPKTSLAAVRPALPAIAVRWAEAPDLVHEVAATPEPARERSRSASTYDRVTPLEPPAAKPFDWVPAAQVLYALTFGAMLLRIWIGLLAGLRLLARSRAAGLITEGIEVRESEDVQAPVALGIVRLVIVLPGDWREWDNRKLEAVLAHERSHSQRCDPAVQLISALHRALLWVSPLSWLLHQRIVRTAEEASDDAAVGAIGDRAYYAETLLDFVQRGIWNTGSAGVAMARYDSPEKRIRRILNATTISRGITRGGVAAIVALGFPLAYVVATAQPQDPHQAQAPIAQASPAPPVPASNASQTGPATIEGPKFLTAEIRASAPNTIPEMRSTFSRGRSEIRNATMVDLIRTAWGVNAENVVGGPEWIGKSRFDVLATAPADSTPAMLKIMLQGLLKDRFQLSAHGGSKDLPAYAITVGKKLHLKEADGAGGSGCVEQSAGTPTPRGAPQPPVTFACRNMTMAAFAAALSGIREASGYLLNDPVLDRTGLTGAWNFDLTWSPRNIFLAAPPAEDALSLFDAFDKQLGLKLSLVRVPTPVVVIDKVKEPQVAGPSHARLEFDVADIRPDNPNAPPGLPCGHIDIQPGGRVRINMTLRMLILETQGDFNTHRIVGGPKSMDAGCWQILAKAPAQENAPLGWSGPVWNGVDIGSMRIMLRSLLEDRFKLVAHTEERPVPGYALVTAKTKLHRADPTNRPGCREGPGADGKDPRLANPLASRLITCHNLTLAEFAAELNLSGTGTGGPVVDATGIHGRYDMTINFSPPSAFANLGPLTAGGDAVASEPNGAISIFEALSRQLGLRLESREVPAPVLVIDHVNEMPTEN